MLGERPSLRQILGIVMASCGVVVILGAPALEGQWLGIGLVLSGALVWAFGQVLIRRLDGALGGFQLTAWIGVMAGPQMLLASCLIDGNPLPAIQAAPIEAWLTVIYLGVVMTAIGYSAWYYVLARYPVPMVMPVLLLLPVAAIFGAVTMLGEVPDPMVLAGGMVVILVLAWWWLNRPICWHGGAKKPARPTSGHAGFQVPNNHLFGFICFALIRRR